MANNAAKGGKSGFRATRSYNRETGYGNKPVEIAAPILSMQSAENGVSNAFLRSPSGHFSYAAHGATPLEALRNLRGKIVAVVRPPQGFDNFKPAALRVIQERKETLMAESSEAAGQ